MQHPQTSNERRAGTVSLQAGGRWHTVQVAGLSPESTGCSSQAFSNTYVLYLSLSMFMKGRMVTLGPPIELASQSPVALFAGLACSNAFASNVGCESATANSASGPCNNATVF